MAIPLGQGYSIPTSTSGSIVIPNQTAPQKQLQTDVKQQINISAQSIGDTYKLLASSSDSTPGFLSAKITSGEFSIVSDKLKLAGFGDLTTLNLTENTNLYWTQTRFDAAFGLKTTSNLAEGSNKYYATSLFNTDFASKTTSDLTEGSNLYFTNARAQSALSAHTSNSSIHLSDLSSFTTDDLIQGGSNLYISSAQASAISANTTARHSHANFNLLETIINSGTDISDAVTKKHTHANSAVLNATTASFTTALKAQYDALSSGIVTSVNLPLELTLGNLSHVNTNGYKHVPTNASASNYDVLYSNGTGVYSWGAISTVVANAAVSIFEASPSTSTTKGVRSAYINTHISNGTTNVKHLTDALLAYINTGGDVPVHLANTLIHLPDITQTTDQGKFLWVNTSDEPEWTTSSTSITKTGSGTYVTASGDTITVDLIDFTDTNIKAGDNITINTSTNEISATRRAVTNTPTNLDYDTCLSSHWGYTHTASTGAGGHIPSGGTSAQYIAGDGSIADFTSSPGGIYKITLGSGATGSVTERLAHGDTVFPSGWSGTAGTVTTDLVITHDAARNPINVTVWVDDGTDITLLMGSAPYSTVIGNQDADEITIVSLTTITEKIYVYIQFE